MACEACAAHEVPHSTVGPSKSEGQLQRLSRRSEVQQTRIRELEGRVALMEAQAKQLEDTVVQKSMVPKETVVIRPRLPDPDDAPASNPDGITRGPRPLLRLYGSSSGEAARDSDSAPAQTAESPVERYRQALRALTLREFATAISKLTVFVKVYPNHPYADNAVYWRGVARYAQRDYRQALADFEQVLRAYPRGNKKADALLNVAYCHVRMGHIAQAKRYFSAVQREYPSSGAAKVAAREARGFHET